VVALDAAACTLLRDRLRAVFATLSKREAGIIGLCYRLTDGQPRTLGQIGVNYGVSRERIRQIKAVGKLCQPSRCQGLRDYRARTDLPVRAIRPGVSGRAADNHSCTESDVKSLVCSP
jgi:hypothetical protein